MEMAMSPTFIFADPNDPDEDPRMVFLFSAQNCWIEGMENAMSNDPSILFTCDPLMRMSALHLAAASPEPNAVDAVRWLLKKGLSWDTNDQEGFLPEDLAEMHENEESRTVLRNWAIEFEYDSYYKDRNGHPSLQMLMRNIIFCRSPIMYLNPHGAPEDEVALVSGQHGTGVMMEWERPIMRETARLLLDGMPTTGLRILNIGFGIGMIDTYFQDAQPAEHVIIEGHLTCLEWMRHKGWYDRPGVRILEGRWQEYFPPTPKDDFTPDIGKFDIVYFDTFEEGYRGHFDFIANVPGLLRGPGSRFSYFNGHGVRGKVQQQVFMEVARLHHNDLGMNTMYFSVDIDPKTIWYDLEKGGKGATSTSREPQKNIPICALAPTVPRRIVLGRQSATPCHLNSLTDLDENPKD